MSRKLSKFGVKYEFFANQHGGTDRTKPKSAEKRPELVPAKVCLLKNKENRKSEELSKILGVVVGIFVNLDYLSKYVREVYFAYRGK